ncbi:hypothetical protein SNEBB_006747 [Seison nebaliae]|nr:hypothetical protein SNEBB_006747 [Seison nebaliae]
MTKDRLIGIPTNIRDLCSTPIFLFLMSTVLILSCLLTVAFLALRHFRRRLSQEGELRSMYRLSFISQNRFRIREGSLYGKSKRFTSTATQINTPIYHVTQL